MENASLIVTVLLWSFASCVSPSSEIESMPASTASALETPQELLRFAPGRYEHHVESGFLVDRQDDRLYLSEFGGVPVELHHLGDGVFLVGDSSTQIEFTTELQQSGGWSHTEVTMHLVQDDGRRQTLERLAGDVITPRELLMAHGYERALPVYRANFEESSDDEHLSEQGLIEAGLSLADAGQVEAAVGLLRIASDLHPRSAKARSSMGAVYRRMGWSHEAQTWFQEALQLDSELPSALKALAELSAESTASYLKRTTRASSGRHIVTLRIWVDSSQLVKLRGDDLWIERINPDRPDLVAIEADQESRGLLEIDGEPWKPSWRGRVSSTFTAEDGLLPIYGDIWVAIRVQEARGEVLLVERPSAENEFTFTMMLDDDEHPGGAWYEFELDW